LLQAKETNRKRESEERSNFRRSMKPPKILDARRDI